jgi:hypothetical protein
MIETTTGPANDGTPGQFGHAQLLSCGIESLPQQQ